MKPFIFRSSGPTPLAKNVLFMAMALCFGHAHGQAPATSGDIMRQIQPAQPSPVPQVQPRRPSTAAPAAAPAQQARVNVTKWQIEGNTVIDTERLLAILAQHTGPEMTIQKIQEAAAQVQQAYEADGWLVRVLLPKQDVTDGVVRLQLIEGRMGDVVMQADGGSRVAPDRVKAVVGASLVKGDLLNTRGANRGLLLADDLSGVSVSGQLKSGRAEGSTDIVVRTSPEPALVYDAFLDNGNARSVGEYRALASVLWSSPGGFGESYAVQGLVSEGAAYLRLGAGAPIGHSGLKGGVAFSRMDYKVVTADENGQVPGIKGSAQTVSVDLAYPWLRSRTQNLYLTSGMERRSYESRFDDVAQASYHVNALQVGVSGNHFDNWGGAASNAYSLTWHIGQVRSDRVTVNNDVAGSFKKLRWSFSRQQALIKGLTLSASVHGQTTGSKPLDSSENMSLGGPGGVRAYPVGEASGPQGMLANVELRWALSSEWFITPFYDHGRVDKRNNAVRGYHLKGAGVSAVWTGPAGWVGKGTYARRIGENANPTETGKDQDGSLRKHRLWLSLARSF